MKLTRYIPNTDAARWNEFRSGFPTIDQLFSNWADDADESYRLPKTNVDETDDAYVFTVEMPGVEKKNVEVTVEGDTLTIKGEKSEKVEDKGALRREFRSARFERSFRLGKTVNREKVAAKMDHGILTVTLPKADDQVGRRIDVA